jgi:ABC-type nitrate/sulfonate/bicarbonate transport system ATPase subunit
MARMTAAPPVAGRAPAPVDILVEGVSKTFGAVTALADVHLRAAAGEFLTLIGPSGCGKTTLLKAIAGLVPVDAGRILVGERPVQGPGPECSMVFQDFALLPWATVQRNVEFGLLLRGVPASERAAIARRSIARVGLGGFDQAYPAQLSGGMQQRVGLARALAVNPQVLLMDEPFASIDEQTRRLFQDELLSLWSEERKTVVFVTHSMEEAVYLSDRVVVLSPRPGRVHRVLDVPLPRPREAGDVRATVEFSRLVDELWKVLRKLQ